ncbi:MAG: gliding motility protein GldM [Paludibacteraceae bacterium]|nr:gliding motility protein GldM [Paludibacteraceae bacterium]
MMYLVYTALLALNVSTDVLNGFSVVQKSLRQSIVSTEGINNSLMVEFENSMTQNPVKVGPQYNKALAVRAKSDALYNQIEQMKIAIIRECDGLGPEVPDDSVKVEKLNARDNLDKSYQIAVYKDGIEGAGIGYALKDSIDSFANYMAAIAEGDTATKVPKDTALIATIRHNFDTSEQPNPQEPTEMQPWIIRTFEHMPAIAAMTLLTQYQQSVRNTEADIIRYLQSATDAGDFRVNKITAEVIPVSSYVTRGSQYQARIILAAVDSTKRPKITVNGNVIEGEDYVVSCNSVGSFDVAGSIELPRADGSISTYQFASNYIVGEPTAIISADKMNVLYAGIENPISVSVPGVPTQNISISATNQRSLVKKGSGWVIIPSKVGEECKISVSMKNADGRMQSVGAKPFRVKQLPPPAGFIAYKDNGVTTKYWGGKPIAKASLMSAVGVQAELQDADIEAKYSVLGFQMKVVDTMGNWKYEDSNGTSFTEKQKDLMRKMGKGKTFLISRIRAKGPDGIERVLPTIEVTIN